MSHRKAAEALGISPYTVAKYLSQERMEASTRRDRARWAKLKSDPAKYEKKIQQIKAARERRNAEKALMKELEIVEHKGRHPIICTFLDIRERSGINWLDLSDKAHVSPDTLKAWRSKDRKDGFLTAFDRVLRVMGYRLTIEKIPEE